MIKLNDRVKNIKESETLKINAKVIELKKEGIDVCSFTVGQPDFQTPLPVVNACKEALDQGFTKYTATAGIVELREAIAQYTNRKKNVQYGMKNVLVSCGAKPAIFNVLFSLIQEGDEVLIIKPYWVSYPPIVSLAGAKPVFVECDPENNFEIDLDDMVSKINKKTKAIIINSPSNPSGELITGKCLEKIAELALKHKLYILSDECYCELIYDGHEHVSIASLSEEVKKQTIIIDSFSKTFSMTGWRIGYAVAQEGIISAANKIQGQTLSNATSFAQKGALAGITGSFDFLCDWKAEYVKRRDFLYDQLMTIKNIRLKKPRAAFYAFPDLSYYYGLLNIEGENSSEEFAALLLDKALIACIPGIAFGMDNNIRISYATDMATIKKGMERLRFFLDEIG